jgi:tetratricopeptide (TPR) repeat protein/CHAT domain-containing protein
MNENKIAQLSHQFGQLLQNGRWQEACELAEHTRALIRQHLGQNHPYYSSSLYNLASIYQAIGRNQEADRVLQELQLIQSSPNQEDPDYVNKLNIQAEQYRAQGKNNEAERLFLQALDIGRVTLGETHPDYIKCKSNLALVYHAKGQYKLAEETLLAVSEVISRTRGRDSIEIAPVLNNLAMTSHAMGNFQRAVDFYQQSLTISRRELGATHPNVIRCLYNLASGHRSLNNYEDAEQILRQLIQEQSQISGEKHPVLGQIIQDLGKLQCLKGNYAAAESLYFEALDLIRQISGEDSIEVAICLLSIAMLYLNIGKYELATPLCQKVTEIFRTSLGENHPEFAMSLYTLAALYKFTGRYDQSKSLYLKALQIRRQTLPKNHPHIADSLSMLGELYRITNNKEDAIKLLLEAAEIRRVSGGEECKDFTESLNSIAMMHQDSGDYTAAENCYTKSLAIIQNLLGKNHPDAAAILGNLGDLYLLMGDYVAAELRLQWAIKTIRIAVGEAHPKFAFCQFNLAEFYRLSGKYVAAESRFRSAITVQQQATGDNHPDISLFLNKLAKLCVATNRQREALSLMQQQISIDHQLASQIFSVSSERQRLSFILNLQSNMGDYLSLILMYFPNSRSDLGTALELVWQRKGIGIEASIAQREMLLGKQYADNVELMSKLRELTTLQLQIAEKMLAQPMTDESLDSYQQTLAQWHDRKEQLEIELAQQIPEIKLDRLLRNVNRFTVADALPAKSTLIEFIRFRVFDFHSIPIESQQPEWKSSRYLALILPAGESENVRAIDLGVADTIDNLLAQFRASIIDSTENRDLDLGSINFSAGTNHPSGVELRKILFDPLLDAIGDCRRLFIAPDGNLALLPFEVLPLDRNRCLLDDYQFSYLSTGRDLIRFGIIKSGGGSTKPLVMADPDFNFSLHSKSASYEGEISPRRQSRDLRSSHLSFRNLPGTRLEGEKIANLLGVKPLLGNQALESHLKTCRSPCILHLATHGFFLQDRSPAPKQDVSIGTDRLSAQNLENPLLRSGLALAGANTWLQRGQLPLEAEDGILTAEDVTGINLADTDLVVLSACGTGLGQVEAGEGVFGLRRSFALAGAKTLVMSLWKVPDCETQELMTDFYLRLLRGQPCAEALRDAQLTMKNKHSDPFYWGAFICQGNPNIVISKSTYSSL